MILSPGTRLGPYEIRAPIGAGGMGEVYRAQDTRLERTVAVKVLPGHLAADRERRERFEREAKAISSLSHAHICALYDVGQQDGVDFLVMEFLEGETLADRLRKGPLPLATALRHGIEIADALDKAHRKGIVHRDLKPANVMLTKSGTKLLDFGLAKLKGDSVAAAADGDSALPTRDKPLTEEGTVVGTVPYMASEQLEGKEADARADIWALGTVLYEMVSGKRAFTGPSRASLIASILEHEPPPLTEVQPLTPPALERVVKRCLAKDPEGRWQSARDLMAELQWITAGGSASAPVPAGRRHAAWAGWLVAGVLLLAVAAQAVLQARRQSSDVGVLRLSVSPPEGRMVDSISLSPDGRHLALVASAKDGSPQIWIRPLDGDSAQPLAGTEDARHPYWSPDSRFLGFFADRKLKKIPASGGAAETLGEVAAGARGGAWSHDGTIVFAPGAGTGLLRVAAAGGTVVPLTTPDPAQRESAHSWPCFLPGGRHLLYLVQSALPERAGIHVLSLDSKETKRLLTWQSRTTASWPIEAAARSARSWSGSTAPANQRESCQLLTGGTASRSPATTRGWR